jgi:methylated-DNA-[protein]-cysteine S-methyltransferase
MKLETATVDTPAGALRLAGHEKGLCAVGFPESWPRLVEDLKSRFGEVTFEKSRDVFGAVSALRRYLGGELDALDGIAVDTGGTAFQQRVWQTLRKIPAGRTWSYRDLAKKIGNPAATRAVGAANGRNPVSVVVPCHRVVAADGSLWGYGGGLERKRWLLQHERAILV